jgi:pyrroline-5-carboxylate reductase
MTTALANQSIAFIGGGNMASAMIGGLVKQSVGAQIQVVEPSPASRELLQTHFPALLIVDSVEKLQLADMLVMAVKPQVMPTVCQQLAQQHGWVASTLIVSIAAGINIDAMTQWFAHRRIVRAMPNTPALIGMGIAGVYGNSLCTADQAKVTALLSSVGQVRWFDNEPLLDAVTALSGSGPAYAFYFLEAMQNAGIQMGLSPADAKALVVQTMKGAAHLAEQSPETLATLRERVTSKGGTTAAALKVMQHHKLDQHIIEALKAAQQRAFELSQGQV